LVIWESQRPSRKLEAGFTGPDREEMLKTGAEPVRVVHQGNGYPNPTDFLHTDQGQNFESTLMSEICKLLGIIKTRTTPYHPQSDGLVERFNHTLLTMLSIVAKDREQDWDLHLPLVMMAYRTSVQESTGATPFSLMFGREARLPIDVMFGPPPGEESTSSSQYAFLLRQRLESSYHRVRTQLALNQRRQDIV